MKDRSEKKLWAQNKDWRNGVVRVRNSRKMWRGWAMFAILITCILLIVNRMLDLGDTSIARVLVVSGLSLVTVPIFIFAFQRTRAYRLVGNPKLTLEDVPAHLGEALNATARVKLSVPFSAINEVRLGLVCQGHPIKRGGATVPLWGDDATVPNRELMLQDDRLVIPVFFNLPEDAPSWGIHRSDQQVADVTFVSWDLLVEIFPQNQKPLRIVFAVPVVRRDEDVSYAKPLKSGTAN